MTISTTTAVDRYTGDDTSTVYSYTFRILDEDEILVQIKDSSGTLTTKTITTDYTVSGVGDQNGGSITFVTAPASTDTVVFSRNMSLTQLVDYQENDTFPAETHEEALDRLTMIAQQINETASRTVTYSIAESSFDAELPAAVANGILGFNSSANGLDIITGVDIGDLTLSGSTANGVMTYVSSTEIGSEPNLTFDGSTLAVTGAGTISSTLSVGGTLSMAGDLVHTGDTDNKIGFTTDTQTFTTGGTSRLDITNSGVRIGSGARVTTILDEDTMSTDSATALATQQSIKAYVDTQIASSSSGSFQFVEAKTASSSSSIEFTDLTVSRYLITCEAIVAQTDNARLTLTASTDNGSSYASSNYQWAMNGLDSSASFNDVSGTASSIELLGNTSGISGIGTATGEFGLSGDINLYNVNVSGYPMMVSQKLVWMNATGRMSVAHGAGITADDANGGSTLEIDAVRLQMTSGNIVSGVFRLYKYVEA